MKKYIIEWANGSKSAMELTKEQVIKAVNNWIGKEEDWMYMIIRNIKTGNIEMIDQHEAKYPIGDITV